MAADSPFRYRVVEDFRRARQRAKLEDMLARLTDKPGDLLSYEDVRRKLRAEGSVSRGLQDIPLAAIVGSVGRYGDFTRSFLPRKDSVAERWSRVQLAMTDLKGLEPIKVYQIDKVYFVLDGNHRVSVARQLGATHIQAYVTEVRSRVPLAPNTSPDELILKSEYVAFLEHTRLDVLRPGADLQVTAPGQYALIEEQIEIQRRLLADRLKRPVTRDEAVVHWYDSIYLPIAQMIRERGMLRDFPQRTETDLYVWIWEHRAAMVEALGWEIGPDAAATDLVRRRSRQPWRIAARMSERLIEAVVPDPLEAGPPPGQWRREHPMGRREARLFADILVPLSSEDENSIALEQALLVARREESRLHGLHVLRDKRKHDSAAARALGTTFTQHCARAGVPSDLAFETGNITRQICERARWADLVVVKLDHPPGPQPVARLRSGFRTLLHRSPVPVLAVPGSATELSRALLAYDGSPKAQEALYIAAYIALQWQTAITVLTVRERGHTDEHILQQARGYLEAYGVEAAYIADQAPVADTILRTARERQNDLIIIGGYGSNPVFEVVLGSTVDQVLRASRAPVLICR